MPVSNSKLLAIDLEMTCFPAGHPDSKDPSKSHITEIGIVEIDAMKLTVVRQSSYLVYVPTQWAFHPYTTELTGITPGEIRESGRPLHEVYKTIANEYGNQTKAVIAWGEDLATLDRHVPAAHPFSRSNFINFARHCALSFGWNERRSLASYAESLGVSYVWGRQHRALPDARVLAEIWLHTALASRMLSVS